jgi:hypothetical protein
VGPLDGDELGLEGPALGLQDRRLVGLDDGVNDDRKVGMREGENVGENDGAFVGQVVGAAVGNLDGATVGIADDGILDGADVLGDILGCIEGF